MRIILVLSYVCVCVCVCVYIYIYIYIIVIIIIIIRNMLIPFFREIYYKVAKTNILYFFIIINNVMPQLTRVIFFFQYVANSV